MTKLSWIMKNERLPSAPDVGDIMFGGSYAIGDGHPAGHTKMDQETFTVLEIEPQVFRPSRNGNDSLFLQGARKSFRACPPQGTTTQNAHFTDLLPDHARADVAH